MNEFTLLREHGAEPTPLTEDVLTKARADLLTEMPALPSELNPIPEGVTERGFTAEPGWIAAVYGDADGPRSEDKEPEHHSVSLTWERSPGRLGAVRRQGRRAARRRGRHLAAGSAHPNRTIPVSTMLGLVPDYGGLSKADLCRPSPCPSTAERSSSRYRPVSPSNR